MSGPAAGGQGLVALLVMIAVLFFIIAYYCWGACCRAFCPRHASSFDDPESQFSESAGAFGLAQPTIILLPYGRMVVVDSRVFSQLQAGSGLDLRELGQTLPALTAGDSDDDRNDLAATPDSEAKDRLSPCALLPPPPAYETIFGPDEDMPPSYDDVLIRQENNGDAVVVVEEQEGDADRNTSVDRRDCDDLRESSV